MAAAVELLRGAVAAVVAERGLGPGARVAFDYEPRPERVALDLAVQAAGCVAVPVGGGACGRRAAGPPGARPPEGAGEEREGRGEVDRSEGAEERELRVEWPEGDLAAPPPGPDRALLPITESELWTGPAGSEGGGADARSTSGAVAGSEEGSAGGAGGAVAGGRSVASDELVRRAGRLEEALAGAAPRRPLREVVVAAGPLADPAERDLLAWAVVAGAAIVLEPAAARLVDTAAWARPTVFLGTAEEAGRLLDRAAAADREGWAGLAGRLRRIAGRPAAPGLPFGRLHTLLVRGAEAPAGGLADRARSRGAAVLAVGAGGDRPVLHARS